MRIFIAGATGVLGRATVSRLVAAGHQVHGIARSPEKAVQLRDQGATPVEGVDLFDPASVRRSRRISSRRFRDATGWVPHFADATIGLEAVAAAHRKAQG